jgi:hypothetical protein
MFKNYCKTGGSNLELSQASGDRLVCLILLICFDNDFCMVTTSENSIYKKKSYVCRLFC